MALSLKSVRQLLKDKPTLQHLEREMEAQRSLVVEIRRLLPADLAEHCTAARIDGRRLVLHTDSPVWASRLRFLSTELLRLLENDNPNLREVKVKLIPQRRINRQRPRTATRSEAGAAALKDAARHMQNRPLRTALERLSERVAPESSK